MTMTFETGAPAIKHFGSFPIHGVVRLPHKPDDHDDVIMMEIDAKIALGWKSRGPPPISTCLAKTTHNITGHYPRP